MFHLIDQPFHYIVFPKHLQFQRLANVVFPFLQCPLYVYLTGPKTLLDEIYNHALFHGHFVISMYQVHIPQGNNNNVLNSVHHYTFLFAY